MANKEYSLNTDQSGTVPPLPADAATQNNQLIEISRITEITGRQVTSQISLDSLVSLGTTTDSNVSSLVTMVGDPATYGNTNGLAEQMNNLLGGQTLQINLAGTTDSNVSLLAGRGRTPNVSNASFHATTLTAVVSAANTFFTANPNLYIISSTTFVDGLLAGGLLPAGYSTVITYSF